MIQNWDRHNLNMDFSHIQCPQGKPSDIDMFYLGKGYLILGEIKNYDGVFTDSQKRLYEGFVDNCHLDNAIAIYINHDKKIEKRDTNVDVAMCFVSEYYIKGKHKWLKPRKPIIVQNIFDYAEENWKND